MEMMRGMRRRMGRMEGEGGWTSGNRGDRTSDEFNVESMEEKDSIRQTEGHTHTNRQTGRQTDTHTHRYTDRYTDRQTDIFHCLAG
jgi:hypothetical protein